MTDKMELPRSAADFDWRKFTPEDSPKTPMNLMADPARQNLATPELQAGDPAYDFELPQYDFSSGRESATGATFHLQQVAAGLPVALIFGSYT